jgi:hypothetical protein
MNTRSNRWPSGSVPRQPVRPRRVDPPIEQTWLFKVNPQRAREMAERGKK